MLSIESPQQSMFAARNTVMPSFHQRTVTTMAFITMALIAWQAG
jgi:hypothetical protein